MSSKISEVLSGAGVLWTIAVVVVSVGGTVYSDVQVLKVENQRLQGVLMEQASIKADVRVLDSSVTELRQNVIYLNTNLKEATDKMNEVLVKLAERVDQPSFRK